MEGEFSAIKSGVLASLAAVFGKFSVTYEAAESACNWFSSDLATTCTDGVLLYLRILSGLLVLGCNLLMTVYFARALRLCSSTIEASLINTSTNFFVTAILGKLLFGELLSWRWFCGTFFIVVGIVILTSSRSENNTEKKNR